MALTLQVVIMDSKDFIIEYKDFKPTDKVDILEYIWKQIHNPSGLKIHIRKW